MTAPGSPGGGRQEPLRPVSAGTSSNKQTFDDKPISCPTLAEPGGISDPAGAVGAGESPRGSASGPLGGNLGLRGLGQPHRTQTHTQIGLHCPGTKT